nr:hypothetical protein [Tanacetum cinerariifolium]
TKDAAYQEVKKYVSSLRYIALPNWVHDALLESSSSKPHDESSTKVPKGSGNPNPTASSSNPLADQMETLTVESPIPTNKPKKVSDALQDPSWVEAMQEELLQFKIQNMDVKSAFLYGTIDEEVYVMRPPGFQDLAFPAKVYKVEKAMYGLHQAPRAWYVLQKEDGIFLSQDKYIGDILKKFGFSEVRSSNTPMDKENPWGKDGTGKDVDLHLYRSMIGSLMYLTASRPDI